MLVCTWLHQREIEKVLPWFNTLLTLRCYTSRHTGIKNKKITYPIILCNMKKILPQKLDHFLFFSVGSLVSVPDFKKKETQTHTRLILCMIDMAIKTPPAYDVAKKKSGSSLHCHCPSVGHFVPTDNHHQIRLTPYHALRSPWMRGVFRKVLPHLLQFTQKDSFST